MLELDRLFIHRVRVASGKDGNALNEVELVTESIMNNDGVLSGNNVIKYVPEKAVCVDPRRHDALRGGGRGRPGRPLRELAFTTENTEGVVH